MTMVWERSEATSTHLLVMLAVADFADDDGFAWPSYERIGLKIRQSTRNAKRVVKQLLDTDELSLVQSGSRGQSNQYRIDIEKLASKEGPRLSHSDKPGNSQGDIQVNPGGHRMSPEPSIEPSQGQPSETSTPTDGDRLFGSAEVQSDDPKAKEDALVREVWEYYFALFGEHLTVKGLSPARWGMIRKGLAAVDGDGDILKRAFDGLKSYRRTHPHGSQDTSIDTVLKTRPGGSNLTDQIEYWVRQSGAKADTTAAVPPIWQNRVRQEKAAVTDMLARRITEGPVYETGQRAATWLMDNFGIDWDQEPDGRIIFSEPTKTPGEGDS